MSQPTSTGVQAHRGAEKLEQDTKGESGLPQPAVHSQRPNKRVLHPSIIIAIWIAFSSGVIVYNKYLLVNLHFPYPVFLTTFHMAFAAVGTRLLARYTNLLDGLANVDMTMERWYRNILPIGVLFSASLILSNMAYLHLSVPSTLR